MRRGNKRSYWVAIVVLGLLLGAFLAGPAVASGVFTFYFDEYGHSNLAPGVMNQDSYGPGGLQSALSFVYEASLYYQQIGNLTVGDVLLMDPTGEISDVIRFNPAQMIFFYSDIPALEPNPPPADVGLPTANYTNLVSIQEIGLEGNNYADYTPGPGQPGYSPIGVPITYHFVSDGVVPLPPSVILLGSGLLGLVGWRRLKKG
jgi:hypothetical protein